MQQANVTRMKVSELAAKVGVDIKLKPKLLIKDTEVTVVEFDGHIFVFDKPISNCAFIIKDERGCNKELYLDITEAIKSFLTKRGWGGAQKPSLHFGQNIYGGLYVMNYFDCWDLQAMPISGGIAVAE